METKKNFFGVDVIKTVAILSVLSIHFLLNTKFYSSPIIGTSLTFQIFYRQLFIICVPLFLITTGYLQWEKSLNRKHLKGIFNIILVYIFLSVFAISVRIFYFEDVQSVSEWIQSVFVFTGIRYAWYVEMYIGLALLIPYLNKIWKSFTTKKEFLVFLSILLLITSLPVYWNRLNNDKPFISMIEFPEFWISLYPITYYFIGVYIRKYGFFLSSKLSFVAFFLATGVQTLQLYFTANHGVFVNSVGPYSSLFVVIQSTFLFASLYKLNKPKTFFGKKIVVLISSISALTLDIYLASAITDRFIYQYIYANYDISQRDIILYAPLIVCISFILAYGIALIRQFIFSLNTIWKRTSKTINSND